MKEISVGILDQDLHYGRRLSRYLLLEAPEAFRVTVFSDPEQARKCLKEQEFSILLVSHSWMEDSFSSIEGKRETFILTEKKEERAVGNASFLYRYQSAKELCQGLWKKESEPDGDEEKVAVLEREGNLLGVYSPVGRCGKTAFSIAMGLQLAREHKTLLCSFDSFSGYRGLYGQSGNEAAELYYYMEKDRSLTEISVQRLGKIKDLDFLPVVREPACLREIGEEGVLKLAKKLAKDCGYEWVILDIGQDFLYPERILKECKKGYLPYLEDSISLETVEAYEKLLLTGREEGEGGQERIWERIKLPFAVLDRTVLENLEQLSFGRLGDMTERMVKQLADGQDGEAFEDKGAGTAGHGTESG